MGSILLPNSSLFYTTNTTMPIMHSIPTNSSSFRESNASFSEDEEDIFMTIDTLNDGRADHFLAIQQPRGGASLIKRNDSLQREEKQIGVDPISLQGSNNIRKASFKLVSTPPRPPNSTNSGGRSHLDPNPTVPPAKLKFISTSLPNSASPSPRSGSTLLNRIWKDETEGSPRVGNRVARRQYSAVDDVDIALQESNVRRSKSLRDGTVVADDFDLMLERPGHHDFDLTLDRPSATLPRGSNYNAVYSFQKPPLHNQQMSNQNRYVHSQSKRDQNSSRRERDHHLHQNSMGGDGADDDRFKCGKLCLFLPRGKGKPVRASSSSSINTVNSTVTGVSSVHSMPSFNKADPPVISRRVSLEKFECGSWASSVVIKDDDQREPTNLFFDLPMELIRCSVSDMQSPVTAAFVFDKDEPSANLGNNEPKGVLKKTSSTDSDRKSNARHVRFSTSSPVISHPSSREDFNVLLDAPPST